MPTVTYCEVKLLDILKEQIDQYKETIQYFIFKIDSILEFCLTPILVEDINLSQSQEHEIRRIINILEAVDNDLREVLNDLNNISI